MAGVFRSFRFLRVQINRDFSKRAIHLKKGPHDYPKVTGSEFWKRKIRTVFRARDVDRDGFLTKKDYEMTVHRVSSYLELDEKQSDDLMKMKLDMWKRLCGDENDPDTYKMTEEEWIRNLKHLFNTKREFTLDYSSAEFDSIDVNKDGFISPDEHKAYFYGLGIPTEHSPAVFKMLDTNGDGKISREEFVQALIDGMLNDHEPNPRTQFLGPLVE